MNFPDFSSNTVFSDISDGVVTEGILMGNKPFHYTFTVHQKEDGIFQGTLFCALPHSRYRMIPH
jgi:hypothetical protein